MVLTTHLTTKDALPEILLSLQDVGLLRQEVLETTATLTTVNKSLARLDRDLQSVKREARRLKKDARQYKDEAAELKRKLDREQLKMSVHFDAHRDTVFNVPGNLTYTACDINVGSGLNITNGLFKAPKAGTYMFSFHANTVKGSDGLILIRHNGATVAGSFDTDNFKHNTLAQSVLVSLQAADIVWVEILSGGVRSNDNLYTHFTGMLIYA